MNWSGKKVLVTGAGGFIGSHLSEALVEAGADVTCMIHYDSRSDWSNLEFLPNDRKAAIKVVAGNVEDAHGTARHVKGQEIVFHLAALIGIPYSYVAPASYVRTNVEGTLNILEAARSEDTGLVVHTSTSEAYGSALYTPIDEDHPMQGQSPYSASKIGADKIAESYHLSFDLPVATIRPFNTYGPRQSARAVIPTIISQALTSERVFLGSLDPVRDLNFVSDTVSGFMRLAETERAVGEVVNIGAGKGISIGSLAERILGLMGLEKEIVTDDSRVRPTKSEVMALICCRDKAKELIGWEPGTDLDSGLEQTIEFVKENLPLFKPRGYAL